MNNDRPRIPKGAKICFGIFMILIYLGMGSLFLLNKFDLNGHTTTSIAIGCLLIVYGIWRGFRLFRSIKNDE